jgi:uncharacterized membrane protein HdeD (DUF308 family)
MSTKLFKNWWLLLIKAISAVLTGFLIIVNPYLMADKYLILFGLLIGISGVALISGAYAQRVFNSEWTWWLLEGLIDILICVLILIKPIDSANFLCLVAGLWLSIMGFIHLATAINLQYYIPGNVIFIITSILLIVSGFFLLFSLDSALKLLMTITGVSILCFGLLLVYISLTLKKVVVEEIGEIEDLY